jgi:hypothetical protein
MEKMSCANNVEPTFLQSLMYQEKSLMPLRDRISSPPLDNPWEVPRLVTIGNLTSSEHPSIYNSSSSTTIAAIRSR